MKRFLLWTLAAVVLLAGAGYAAFKLSPWPGALLIRWSFDQDAEKASQALAALVPPGIVERLDLAYDPEDSDGRLDLFLPPGAAGPLPVVVWVHGGAWVSGDKDYLANYLRILASQGFATVGINYTIAPEAEYPTPVRQLDRAMAWLLAYAEELGIDPQRILLAGDSAGAQIASQYANLVTDPAYAARIGIRPALPAAQLRGLVLHCGAYDPTLVSLEGAFGDFLKTIFWAYFGRRDFLEDPRLKDFSILANLSAGLPPLFVSAGNADPLAPQSYRLAELAQEKGLEVETLFFPPDYQPRLEHEYQFTLDTEAGRLALERSAAFIRKVSNP